MGTRTYSRRGVLTSLGRQREAQRTAAQIGAPVGAADAQPSRVNLEQEMNNKSLSELSTIGTQAESTNDFERAYAAYSEMANKRLETLPQADGRGLPVIYDEQTPTEALDNVGKAAYQAYEAIKAIALNGASMEESSRIAKYLATDLIDMIQVAQADIVTADRRADRGLDTDTQYINIAGRLMTRQIKSKNTELNRILANLNSLLDEASSYFYAGADSGFINPY